jgi:hypothetical protein
MRQNLASIKALNQLARVAMAGCDHENGKPRQLKVFFQFSILLLPDARGTPISGGRMSRRAGGSHMHLNVCVAAMRRIPCTRFRHHAATAFTPSFTACGTRAFAPANVPQIRLKD